MDSSCRRFVGTPGFGSELQGNSGQDPNQFLNGEQTPAQAILGAEGGAGLNGTGLQNYASLLGDTAAQFQGGEPPGSVYAGGGGGAGAAAGAPDDTAALSSAMAGLMKTLNPGAEKEKIEAQSLNVIFQKQAGRAPSSLNPDDPTVSIFDRVSSRYRFVSDQLDRSALGYSPPT